MCLWTSASSGENVHHRYKTDPSVKEVLFGKYKMKEVQNSTGRDLPMTQLNKKK